MLDINNEKKYYKRTNNQWIYDNKVREESFINNDTLYQMIRDSKSKSKKNLHTISRNYNSLTLHKNIYIAEFKTRLDEEEMGFKKEIQKRLEKQI